MKNTTHAYAVIRIDHCRANIIDRITVKEIVWSIEKAETEVGRLNELNKDKGCFYFWQLTRVLKT